LGRHKLLDEEKFHSYLWENSDRFNRIKINQSQLAEDLAVNRRTIVRLLGRLKEDQIIRPVKKGKDGIVTYQVMLPEFPQGSQEL